MTTVRSGLFIRDRLVYGVPEEAVPGDMGMSDSRPLCPMIGYSARIEYRSILAKRGRCCHPNKELWHRVLNYQMVNVICRLHTLNWREEYGFSLSTGVVHQEDYCRRLPGQTFLCRRNLRWCLVFDERRAVTLVVGW